MKRDYEIEKFLQHLYSCYDMPNSSISYGYNEVSETYIIKIDNAAAMGREDFQLDLFNFSQERAEANVWVMFVTPDDSINFSAYEPVSSECFKAIPSASEDIYQMIQQLAFEGAGWFNSSDALHLSEVVSHEYEPENHSPKYAMAA
jgi:hypothetical protein